MSLIYGYWQNIEPKIHKDFYTISCLCVINCFKYFIINTLGQNVKKNQARKILNQIKSSCIILCA